MSLPVILRPAAEADIQATHGELERVQAGLGERFVGRVREVLQRKLSDTLAEAGDKFVGRMVDRLRGKKTERPVANPQPKPTPWAWYLPTAATAFGLVGALSGTAGWVRREDPLLAGSAIVAGSVAVAWTYIVAALVIAFVIGFLLLLLGSLSP